MFENFDDILTVEEACEALKIGYNAMYELLNTGKLKGYRNGRVWRIPRAALVEYIRNCTLWSVQQYKCRMYGKGSISWLGRLYRRKRYRE
ncbi:helix-turn-helix domain-containing protein [Dysosmobacter sp.]|uniref:helix-turn-helix domain-containing protein n=1 Tax=Dysosmobacter sp. TaxID=2591382 RepID=UPI003AAB3221